MPRPKLLLAVLLPALAGAALLASPSCRTPAPAVQPSASSARVFAERLGEGKGLPGLENAARVAPGIYRGAQPTEAGLDSLKALGVKTVVNLRHHHGDAEEAACRDRGLDYVRIALESSDAPDDAAVRHFLEVVTDPARQPVFFHCKLGCDRTGTMCACYRMAVEGWPLEDALMEMDAFGFHAMWKDLRAYVEGFHARAGSFRPSR